MTALSFAILAMLVFWWLNKGPRVATQAAAGRRNKITGDSITYTQLAAQRHNILTARNMIKLNLVVVRSADDEKIRHIYNNGDTTSNQRMHLLAHRYGLVSHAANYVGD